MESPDLIAVRTLETPSKRKAAVGEELRTHLRDELAVRTKDRVVIFDATGKQHSALPIPEELRGKGYFTVYDLGAGTALLAASRLLPDWSRREELSWIDASGKVLRRAEFTTAEGNPGKDAVEAWKTVLTAPAPLVLACHVTNGLEPDYSAALARCLAAWWPALLTVTLLAAALAWHCCRRHRRYYQPYSGVWFVFVLLTGVPGLVAYLFCRCWPVLEKCRSCGQEVPHDREACANCGAAFPLPEPKGCEVFA
jgi:hypothetical protein